MQKSTFKLTKHELDFISDAELMLLKQKLIRKLGHELEVVGKRIQQQHYHNSNLQHKVTKGENYLGQPYLVLDVPQLKAKEISGKMRLMFWWGHYFSLQFFFTVTENSYHLIKQLNTPDLFIFIGKDLFNNDLSHEDFVTLDKLTKQQLDGLPTSKICRTISLNRFDLLQAEATNFLNLLLHTIH
jgi:hypothetical protein